MSKEEIDDETSEDEDYHSFDDEQPIVELYFDLDDEESLLQDKIRQQIEFYFSDSNYPQDSFLRKKAAQYKGYVPLDVLCTFKLLKKITTDKNLIISACQQSDKVELSDDQTAIKRIAPLPNDTTTSISKSIYVEGFDDQNDIRQNIDYITDMFGKYGTILCVRLKGKGAAFVEFQDEKRQQKALQAKLHNNVADKPLIITTKKTYIAKLSLQKKEKKLLGNKRTRNEPNDDFYPKGVVVHFVGVGENCDRVNDLQPYFETTGKVVYIKHQPKNIHGFIRFASEAIAKKALIKLKHDKKELGGSVPTYRLIYGDEEKLYWQIFKNKKRRKEQAELSSRSN